MKEEQNDKKDSRQLNFLNSTIKENLTKKNDAEGLKSSSKSKEEQDEVLNFHQSPIYTFHKVDYSC